MLAVSRFAVETGDAHALSAADVKLLALVRTLEQEAHGTIHIREHPSQASLGRCSQPSLHPGTASSHLSPLRQLKRPLQQHPPRPRPRMPHTYLPQTNRMSVACAVHGAGCGAAQAPHQVAPAAWVGQREEP